MNEKITVLTVNWYSSDLLNNMLSSVFNKAKYPKDISVLIIDNTFGRDDALCNLENKFSSVKIIPCDPRDEKGLNAHAIALNFGFQKIKTPYLLIIDPDVFIFKRDWDFFLKKIISEKKVSAIGTAYPRWWLGTYHNFPSPVFFFASMKELKKIKPDWLPLEAGLFKIAINGLFRNFLRAFFCFRRKYLEKFPLLRACAFFLEEKIPLCSYDTGSKLASFAKNNFIESECFNAVFHDEMDNVVNHNNKLDVLNEISKYFELYEYSGELMLTHQYGSQNLFLRTDKGSDSNYWRELIEKMEN